MNTSLTTNTKVTAMYSSFVHEVSVQTVDKLKEYLASKTQLTEDMHQHFEEFKNILSAQIQTTKTTKKGASSAPVQKEKKKRSLSNYNIYIQNKIKELREAGHSGNLMKMAVESYNNDKKAKAPTSSSSSDEE